MKRRFLLLHGLDNRRPPDHWLYWLAERLRARGELVAYPQLPSPHAPRREDWEEVLHGELGMLGDGERIVVAHSLGATLWLRAAAEHAVDRVLLVAPPSRRMAVRVAPSFALGAADPGTAARSAASTVIACSDRDPYNPERDQAELARAIGARLTVVPGAGHLSTDDGYTTWPAAEAWCLDPAAGALEPRP